MTILAELYASAWAVRPEVLQAVLGYVERHDVTPEMLARSFHFDPAVQEMAKTARWNRYAVHQQASVLVDGSQALYRRGRTAILPITGPIVRRGNLMSSLSGGPMTSVELLAKDFTRAVEDDSFEAIVLDIDSPGGEAAGISELAAIIRAARETKPITAYAGDLAASAAYWLASAASEVVINKTAAVGSIGVVMAVPDPAANQDGYVQFVSSASPNKRPDPHSKAGKAEHQQLVDALGDLFVDDIATYRAVSRETVLTDFGAGGLRVGADAVERGMADRLGSFEEVLADLGASEGKGRQATGSTEPEPPADDVDDALADLAPDRPRSPRSAVAASSAGGAPMGSLLDGLRQLVAAAEAPASADLEAQIMTQHTTSPTVPTAAAISTLPSSLTPDASGDATLRQRLVAAEAENARLRLGVIQSRAEAFAKQTSEELRAFPPEVPHLVALYCLLASDDETHGPIQLGAGKTTTRISHLENLMASRQSRKDLTADVFGDTVAHVLTERSRPKVQDEAATAEELAAYLDMTPTGRSVLKSLSPTGPQR